MCRDEADNYMGSSALVLEGSFDPATLEAVACREALSLAEDLHVRKFFVSSNCKQVVQGINMRSQGRFGAILSEINLKATEFQCIFSFESRVVNYEAHSLAKFSKSWSSRLVWSAQ